MTSHQNSLCNSQSILKSNRPLCLYGVPVKTSRIILEISEAYARSCSKGRDSSRGSSRERGKVVVVIVVGRGGNREKNDPLSKAEDDRA